MNNLVFNSEASQLKNTIYGLSDTQGFLAIKTNDAGNVVVAGSVTVNNNLTVSGAVTVNNNLTVSGAVTVNNNLTVSGAVTVNNNLTVSGSVTVANVITALINGYTFTAINDSRTNVSTSGVILSDLNISHIREGTIFVYNKGLQITVGLEISPLADANYYVPDINYPVVTLGANKSTYLTVGHLGQFARLQYGVTGSSSFEVYYNAQGY